MIHDMDKYKAKLKEAAANNSNLEMSEDELAQLAGAVRGDNVTDPHAEILSDSELGFLINEMKDEDLSDILTNDLKQKYIDAFKKDDAMAADGFKNEIQTINLVYKKARLVEKWGLLNINEGYGFLPDMKGEDVPDQFVYQCGKIICTGIESDLARERMLQLKNKNLPTELPEPCKDILIDGYLMIYENKNPFEISDTLRDKFLSNLSRVILDSDNDTNIYKTKPLKNLIPETPPPESIMSPYNKVHLEDILHLLHEFTSRFAEFPELFKSALPKFTNEQIMSAFWLTSVSDKIVMLNFLTEKRRIYLADRFCVGYTSGDQIYDAMSAILKQVNLDKAYQNHQKSGNQNKGESMTDILSQGEIDDLLNAIYGGDIASDEDQLQDTQNQKKVRIYDFKRPEKITKDQIRQIQMIHEEFARLATNALSEKLRSMLGIHVVSVDQLLYQEFIRSIPNPNTLAIIDLDFSNKSGLEVYQGSALLEIDPAITFTMIDRQFGGNGDQYKINRELTDIEILVMKEIIEGLLQNLKEAWSNRIDFKPSLRKIETNPQYAEIISDHEMVLLITMEAKIGESEGMMNLCFPAELLEALLSKPDSPSLTKETSSEFTENLQVNMGRSFSVQAMTIEELVSLKPGDTLSFSENSGRPLYNTKLKMEQQNG